MAGVLRSCGNVCKVMEESGALCRHRRPSGHRRRTRSTGSLPWLNRHSGDSSSSMGEWEISRDIGMSSLYQSDSDDVSGAQGKRGLYNLQPARLFNIESDSVNENFSPVRPITRRKKRLIRVLRFRKRKLKRMAVDVEMASTSTRATSSLSFATKKKRFFRHNCENRWATSGKRKRSGGGGRSTLLPLHRLSIHSPPPPGSGSSVSSSESEAGIYTNDEGREGDDEQSDWVGEASGGWGVWEDSEKGDEPTLLPPTLLVHRLGRGREIRGGRRRVRSDKASFSIVTSANEQLSRFLRDPARSQLRLHPMREQERHKLGHLADLYSLDMHLTDHHKGLTCPVLTKTSNTVRVDEPVAMGRLYPAGHVKRRRRTPPKTSPFPHHALIHADDGDSGNGEEDGMRSSQDSSVTMENSQDAMAGDKSS